MVDQFIGWLVRVCSNVPQCHLFPPSRLLGILVAVNKNNGEDFSDKDKDHFIALCNFSSLILNNCQTNKELTRLRVKFKV